MKMMYTYIDTNDPDFFRKRMIEKQRINMENYENGVVFNSFEGASYKARIIRNAPKPKPL